MSNCPARAGPLDRLAFEEALAETMLFPATIARSLPKPGWLAETEKLWPKWKLAGAELDQA